VNRISAASIVVPFTIAMTAIILTGCSSRFVSPSKEITPAGQTPSPALVSQAPTQVRSSSEGAVTIDVGWDDKKATQLEFSVVMNTHSVDLDQYDLGKLTVLQDDSGNKYQPLSWQAPAGGHHRSGMLIFPLPDSVRQGKAKYFEIVIRDVDSIKERVFRWEP